MAVAARGTVASLMQKTLDRQAASARMKFKLKQNQVQNILLSYIAKDPAPYYELIEILRSYPLNDDNFKFLLDDCLSLVILMGKDLTKFVNVVCNIDWTNKNEENVQLFSKFIIDLVTAHTYHASLVITSLVKVFKENNINWEDRPSEELITKWSHIHTIIAQIVAIMPMASDILMQSIIEQFPYYKAGVGSNRSFVYNIIWISKYIPMLLEPIMTAIINRLVVMDVNIVDQSKNKAQNETMFSMEIDEDPELKNTLDYCMLDTLLWLQDERDTALPTLCNVFDRIVLPTHGIRHVQFLILYTISVSQQCADRILQNLWSVMAGVHNMGPTAIATRRTACSHLAGLLARCVRMPNTRLVLYLKNMTDWCHAYITASRESNTVSDSVKVHGAFYAMCHAVFYLIAFKHKHLFMTKEGINFVESLNLPRLVKCNLNPLKTCPPHVAQAFSSVTRSHQLVYCQAIIEKNARHTLQAYNDEKIDDWFPYDPYTLPISGKIIWPLCTEYKDWLQDGEDESQYTSRMKKMVSDDDDYLMSTTPTARLASSLSNCISPGFKST